MNNIKDAQGLYNRLNIDHQTSRRDELLNKFKEKVLENRSMQ